MIYGILVGSTSMAGHLTSEHTYHVSSPHSGAGTQSHSCPVQSKVLGRARSTLMYRVRVPLSRTRSTAKSGQQWMAWSEAGRF